MPPAGVPVKPLPTTPPAAREEESNIRKFNVRK
jgi:hypothetical protein